MSNTLTKSLLVSPSILESLVKHLSNLTLEPQLLQNKTFSNIISSKTLSSSISSFPIIVQGINEVNFGNMIHSSLGKLEY